MEGLKEKLGVGGGAGSRRNLSSSTANTLGDHRPPAIPPRFGFFTCKIGRTMTPTAQDTVRMWSQVASVCSMLGPACAKAQEVGAEGVGGGRIRGSMVQRLPFQGLDGTEPGWAMSKALCSLAVTHICALIYTGWRSHGSHLRKVLNGLSDLMPAK